MKLLIITLVLISSQVFAQNEEITPTPTNEQHNEDVAGSLAKPTPQQQKQLNRHIQKAAQKKLASKARMHANAKKKQKVAKKSKKKKHT